MKHPLVWVTEKKEFKILWIWRISLVFANTFEDKDKIGVYKGKRSILFWYKNIAVGFGHSIGAEVEARALT